MLLIRKRKKNKKNAEGNVKRLKVKFLEIHMLEVQDKTPIRLSFKANIFEN